MRPFTFRVFYLPIFRRIEGGESTGPCGSEKIVVLRGLIERNTDTKRDDK